VLASALLARHGLQKLVSQWASQTLIALRRIKPLQT
jgi:hypothetical protein